MRSLKTSKVATLKATATATAIEPKDYDHTYILWIIVLLSITLVYVGKGTLHIGMGLLGFIYIVSWIFLYKWVSSKEDFTTEYNGVKATFETFMNGNPNYIMFLFGFLIICIVGASITFLYGGKQVPNSNDWWISADVFLSVIIALVIYAMSSTSTLDAGFHGLCAIFVGTGIWNFVNLAKVTDIINQRSKLIGTYDMGSGNLSKKSLDLITGFLVLFYLFVVCMMVIVFLSMSEDSHSKKIMVSLLVAIGITIGNHFLTKEIIDRVKVESVPTKTESEKAKDTSQEKVQNQNIFSNAYYSILRFFNNPAIM